MIFIGKDIKQDPEKRWNLPDEVFFAAGACQVLAYAFLKEYPELEFKPLWIKPIEGYRGNHIIVTDGKVIFDYSGYHKYDDYFRSLEKEMLSRAAEDTNFEGWDYTLEEFPIEFLISEKESKAHGLWLRQPNQFLHNAMPRARAYLKQFEKDRVNIFE